MADRKLTFGEALNEALHQEMARDPDVVVFGENVSSSWRVPTRGLKEKFGAVVTPEQLIEAAG